MIWKKAKAEFWLTDMTLGDSNIWHSRQASKLSIIRDVTHSSLRKAIGVVQQEPVLFNTSIGYNIGYVQFYIIAFE